MLRGEPEADRRARRVFSGASVVEHYRGAVELQPAERLLIERFIHGSSRVVDIGIGAGRTTRFLSDRGRYVGFDLVAEMVAATKRDLGEGRLVVATAGHVPLASASFDVALFSFNGLGHVDDRSEVYNEVRRLVVEGGMFIFSLHNPRYIGTPTGRTPSVVARWLVGAPLRTIRSMLHRGWWRSQRTLRHPGGTGTGLDDLEIVGVSRARVRKELAAAGFRVTDVLAGPRPRTPGIAAPWFYYAARVGR
jgi:SAM-dependent methyltransferase